MKYVKPPLTIEAQADLLLARGMKGDKALMMSKLAMVSYYRLSGYWFPHREPDDSFRPNTTFEAIWQRYTFDRQLRLIVMDAIERIEVAVRSQIASHLAQHNSDPFAYANDPTALPGLTAEMRNKLFADLLEQQNRSRETFAEHFRQKYGDAHVHMPVWMACEIMTFGNILTLFRGVQPDIRKKIAQPFGIHDTVLSSWLLALNTVRNTCAHHCRLWNREFGTKPKIPEAKRAPDWHTPVVITNERIFGILTICRHALRVISPESLWADRLKRLLARYPYVPRGSMGFPKDWESSPIWK